MKDNRGLVYCDVCGRQIINIKYEQNDKYSIGSHGAIQTDINTHICRECKIDPIVKEQEGLNE